MVVINGMQCRLARAALNWSLDDLFRVSGLHSNTVNKFENGSDPRASTLRALEAIFTEHGIEFPDEQTIRFPASVLPGREAAKAA